MIRLKQLLVEIGDATATPYPFTMHRSDAYFVTDGGTEYQVSYPIESNQIMEISFAIRNSEGEWQHDVETAESDTYRVMSTIVRILRQAIDKHKPIQIGFAATKSDLRRMRMYRKYLANNLNGYHVVTDAEDILILQRDGASLTKFDWTGIKNKF